MWPLVRVGVKFKILFKIINANHKLSLAYAKALINLQYGMKHIDDDLRKEASGIFHKLVMDSEKCIKIASRLYVDVTCTYIWNTLAYLALFGILISLSNVNPFLIFGFLITVFGYYYESKRAQKIFKELVTYMEKDVQGTVLESQRIIPRISSQGNADSK